MVTSSSSCSLKIAETVVHVGGRSTGGHPSQRSPVVVSLDVMVDHQSTIAFKTAKGCRPTGTTIKNLKVCLFNNIP